MIQFPVDNSKETLSWQVRQSSNESRQNVGRNIKLVLIQPEAEKSSPWYNGKGGHFPTT